jgi:hypothetical protein
MPVKRIHRKSRRYPHEETWLREFLGYHGTDGVTSFVDEDLGGASLTLVVEALCCGIVVAAGVPDGSGTRCVVEYYTEDGSGIVVIVHFSSSEERLRIISAELRKGLEDEPDHAA